MSVTLLNNEITTLKNEINLISLRADSYFMSIDSLTNTSQLLELANELSFSSYTTKNTLTTIQKLFKTENNKLSDIEKYALWKLLLKYCQLIDKNITDIEQVIKTQKASTSIFFDALNETKNNLAAARKMINLMDFKASQLYRRSLLPIDVSSIPLDDLSFKERVAKPGFINKMIARLCLKAITNVAEKEEDIAATLQNTLLSSPNDIHNYQLRIDQKTIVQAVEYLNPDSTDKWLIVVGGAGAAYTNMLPIAKELALRNNANFLVVDYLAQKPASFSDPVKIILAAATFLLEKKKVKPENLVLMGHSNGGRLVLQAAAHLPGCSVVTNNTYTSLEEAIISNVLNGAESLKNMGIPVGEYTTEIINTVTDFFKKHHLDKKALNILHTALKETNNGYQSEYAKSKVPDHKYAAVYTAPCTGYNSNGEKLPKAGDKLLFDAVDGKVQAKKAKQDTPTHREQLQERNKFFNRRGLDIIGVKYKDSPNPEHRGHHIVIKGITHPTIKNTHNVIDANLLSSALKEVEKEKNFKPQTLRERFEILLDKYDLSSETESQLSPVGIELNPSERFLLTKAMIQLNKTPYHADMPTQIQLMRLFQASDVAADIISSYKSALDKMIRGQKPSEYKEGMRFLNERLNTLNDRSEVPDPRLYGTGSYLSKNLAGSILKRLQRYHAESPISVNGLFSGRSPINISVKRCAQTVSDLDLTQLNQCVLVRA